MANDREVLRELWEGKLPVCFILDPDEVVELQQPDPYYLMVPRVSYFPLVIDKVRKHFLSYVISDKMDQVMWLEFNGQPLKWHYPIGVLFDLLAKAEDLPWTLTAHFEKFPEEQIYHFKEKESIESYFMSCLKEADVLKFKGQIVSSMQIKDHNQIWMGLLNDKFDQFWAVNRKLMEVTPECENFRHIPFRCYLDDGYRQMLVKPVSEDGQRKTLKDLLNEVFPGKETKVKTHGICPPLDTPLQWMSEHLSYPDNFLHLCVEAQ
ncbi:autophagy protein 5 [Coccinella septempunctata]|uniref:autophagy protein 5 n=1 Tax=Coccinella septempunctata TaxID=41139 RepID=UPI001D086436|nr:autophagy protein 5 [Coccinella septempunctata]